jgi:NADH dehydrogenase
MILVVGATGLLGAEICQLLAAAGKPFRALVRATSPADRVGALHAMGAELVTGDLKDRGSLDAACQGVRAVITTASAMLSSQAGDSIEAVDQAGHLDLIDAANGAGVSRFVYVSYSGNVDQASPLTTAKRTVEQALKSSGLTYTILRPSFFMEMWLSPRLGFDFADSRATTYGFGERPISFISVEDVAQFAVESLGSTAAQNATFELGGQEAVSPLEAIGIFEDVSWRAFTIEHVPQVELRSQYEDATDGREKSFAALLLAYAQGDAVAMQEMLRAPGTVRDYAERVVKVERVPVDLLSPAR